MTRTKWCSRVSGSTRCVPRVLVPLFVVTIAGCAAGIKSTPIHAVDQQGTHTAKAADGLIYFLPERDVIVSVTVTGKDKSRIELVNVASADARPDFQSGFAATIPRNWAGVNDATIQVNDKGLLHTETKTETTSSLTDILRAAASAAGVARMNESRVLPLGSTECPEGVWKTQFSLPLTNATWCGYRIAEASDSDDLLGANQSADAPAKGLFYRIQIPRKVTVSKDGFENQVFTIFSPTGSKTFFLPLAGSAFGTNKATFAFDQGVPTKYHQSVGNEVQGVLGAPAAVLQSYYASIGAMFGAKKEALSGEADYATQISALAIANARNEACVAAVRASADLTAIKAACGAN